MENKGRKKSINLLKVGIEKTSIEKQKSLGVFDVDKYEKFETSVEYDLDKFKKFEKFGFYSDARMERVLKSGKPLTDLDKLVLSNLLYEYKYFRAYFETVQKSVKLFGDEKGTLKEVLGKSLLHLKNYLWLWRARGERMNMKPTDWGVQITEKDKALYDKCNQVSAARALRCFKIRRRVNGKDIESVLHDYCYLVDYYEEELYGRKRNTVTSQVKRRALELIKDKYKFSSVDAVKKCLQREGIKGFPRL